MKVEIEGVTLHLAHPDELTITWVGQEEVMRQLLASWLVVDPQDVPMNPRLLGKPGVGKTTLAYAAAKRLQPQITIDFPERHEEYAILRENVPFGEEQILNYVTEFLQQAHSADERYTVRDGINIARFVMKLKSFEDGLTLSSHSDEQFLMRMAILETLGDEAQ